jgi:alkanesulfonate monooxygenase SsuD/methylene tetrahydromethanopterin reductase-like flavin-dependent oxidoreductase (luciferase family)
MASSHLILSVSLNAAGHHPAAWRSPRARRSDALSGAHYRDLAKLAERGGLDMVLLGYPARGSVLAPPQSAAAIQLDAMSLAAALIPDTGGIGLAAVAPATYWEPFNIARSFSGLDNLSRGRFAWCVDAAWREPDLGNFSRLGDVDPAQLAARTREFLEVAFALWDSWEDDALVFDKANAMFTDHTKVHRIDHAGAFFKVEGPANSPRPVQGRPVIIQTDARAAGLELAAETADVLIVRPATIEAASATTRSAKAAAAALSRQLIVLADIAPILDHAGETGAARLEALQALGAAPADAEPLAFVGAPAALADLMQAWARAGACDGFNLLPAVLPTDLEAIVSGVVPELARRGLAAGDRGDATLRARLGLTRPVSRYAVADHG